MRQGCRKLLIFSLILFFSLSSYTMDVFASSHSWVQNSQEYKEFYNQGIDGVFDTNNNFDTGDEQIDAIANKKMLGQPLTEEEQTYFNTWAQENLIKAGSLELLVSFMSGDDDVGWAENAIAGIVYSVGRGAYVLLNKGAYPFTINNLVFGRMCDQNRIGISLVQFELTTYNPYGIVSAYLYRILRSIAYTLFLFSFLAELVRQVYAHDKKSRSELKNTCQMIVFMFLLIYIFPKVADFVLYLKDVIMKLIYDEFDGLVGLGTDIVATFRGQYQSHGSLLNAFMFDAAVFCVIPFAFSYIKIALMQLLLFGGAPVIFVLSIRNQKLLSSWASTFFSNIFIPVIDMVLILLPVMLNTIKSIIISNVPGVRESDVALVFALIELTCIFAVTPMRNVILRMVGNMTGMQMGGSLGGLGMIAVMAARTMGSLKNRGGERGYKQGGNANYESDKALADHMGAVNDSYFDSRQNSNSFRNLPDFESGSADDNSVAMSQPTSFGASGTGMNGMEDNDMVPNTQQMGIPGGVNAYEDSSFDDSDRAVPESVAELSGAAPMDLSDVGSGVDSINNATQVQVSPEDYDESGITDTVDYPQISGGSYDNMIPSVNMSSSTSGVYSDNGTQFDMSTGYGGIESVSQSRLDNLQKMDTYKTEMSRIADSNYQLQSNIDKASEQKARVDAMLAGGVDSDGVTPLTNERRAELNHEALSLSAVEGKCQSQIKANNDRMSVMKTSYDNAVRAEKSYAEMYAQAGMSKQTYTSSTAFKRQMRIDNAKRELATYKNFDTKQFENVLTPAEREKYYRQRATHDARVNVAKAGLKVAYGTAVATTAIVGAAAGAYSGPSSAAAGALLGAKIPGMAAGLGRKAGHAGVNAVQTLSNIRTPKDRRMYSFPNGTAQQHVPQPHSNVETPIRTVEQDKAQPYVAPQPVVKQESAEPKKSVVDVFDERAERGKNLDLSKYLDGSNE